MARSQSVKNSTPQQSGLSRRGFLSAAAATTVGLYTGFESGFGQSARPATTPDDLVNPARSPSPWWLGLPENRSRVVEVRSRSVLHASAVDAITLGTMLDEGMRKLTGSGTVSQALRAVLGSSERVVVKFNSVGAGVLNTNDALARHMVLRLSEAGYAPENLMLVEVPAFLPKQLGTSAVKSGWGRTIRVGEALEPLARYLDEADAIINVPLLKTHQIAGMTGCMKNLSHALIRHPARYHGNGCSPYVGQVIGSQEVSAKLLLNVVNAIRVVIDRGPSAREQDIVGYGGLLLGFDPIAIDNVGLSILFRERRRLGLSPSLRVPYLASAAAMGLGRWRPAEINLVSTHVDG